MSLLQRARDSGMCPPSLLSEERISTEDGFEEAVSKILDSNGLSLSEGDSVAEDFKKALEMTELNESATKEALEFRRCILLTIVGITAVESPSLKSVLEDGFLVSVKTWFDEILSGSVGGVDLLLHLLTNIRSLPVTKSIVKASGMGKAIGSIEKHPICAGTPNQSAIMDRVQEIKSAWNASVKARKDKPKEEPDDKPVPKRQLDSPTSSPSIAKRPKLMDDKKKSAFSSLLKKVSVTSPDKLNAAKSQDIKSPTGGDAQSKKAKNKSKRVKWADHFGGDLSMSKVLDSVESTAAAADTTSSSGEDSSVSWTDRKKRDRLREKELLAKAKRSKLMDDDDDVETPTRMTPTREWRQPNPMPELPDVTKAQLVSKEISVQVDRMTKAQPARYVSEDDVPNSPAPLSDVEQALDMTSQASTATATMPFFIPQVTAAAPAVAPAPTIPASAYAPPAIPHAVTPASAYAPPAPQTGAEAATAHTVQALGLPMFLVGQNVQALQTLASSPSLLSTLVEPNGQYDQPRLLSLVQTLSQSVPTAQPPPAVPAYQQPPTAFGGPSYPPAAAAAGGGIYGPASGASGFGQPAASAYGGGPRGGGYRGDQNNSEGNLHISGYGPTATQADIIGLFAPYVHVDEVVMKGTFSFVNTSDPMGAKRAKDALNGALLHGAPVRINMAQRRSRDSGAPPPSFGGPPGGGMRPPGSSPFKGSGSFGGPPGGGGDGSRDDRGNPATKNLFVAGYGPGTTEQQLRDIFGQYATIVGVVTKGTFSFVNTSDKNAAIRARDALSNTNVNGGNLRINFAKETGRLGTSFDLTYGPGSGGGGGPPPPSHYGRSF